MISIISPAKSLTVDKFDNFDKKYSWQKSTKAIFKEKTAEILANIKKD